MPIISDDLDGQADDSELPCCEDVTDTSLEGCDTRTLEILLDAGAELATAATDAEVIVSEMVDSIRLELSGLEAISSSVTDELIGATDLIVSELETKSVKVVMSQSGTIDRELIQCVEWCLSVGVQVPYHPAEMTALIQGDWLTMLIQAVPAVATALGHTTTTTNLTNLTEGDTYYGPSESSTTTNEFVVGGDVTSYYRTGTNGTAVPPPSPVVPPSPGPITTVKQLPGTGGDITVNVWVPPPPPAQIAVVGPDGRPCPPGAQEQEEEETHSPPTAPPPPEVDCAKINPNHPLNQPGASFLPQTERDRLRYEFGDPCAPPKSTTVQVPAPTVPTAQQQIDIYTAPPKFVAPDGVELGASAPLRTMIVNAVNWDDLRSCEAASILSKAPTQNLASQPAGPDKPKSMLANYLEGKLQWENWLGIVAFPLFIPLEIKQLVDAWAKSESAKDATAESAAAMVAQKTILASIGPNAVPNKSAAAFFGGKLAAARWVEGKTNFPLDYLMTADRYLFQFSNPQELPNQIRTDDAFLANTISADQWECWTKANGNLPTPAKKVMLGNQTRPGVDDLLMLWRRGHLSEKDLYIRCRDRGVLEEAFVREYIAITTQLPQQSDLIRFMVRDASDDKVAEKYGYDTDFETKFTPRMKAWAKALGLDETYFRYSWRAHWEIPSYTQLREMFHRLREDRPEVVEWDRDANLLGKAATELARGPRPPVVTRDDMREALQINDVAPGWVDAMIDVSYTPINRTDAIRAYQIGAFTEERLADAFRDVGYSPSDTATLVKYHSQDKARRRANVTGTWSTRKITTYYKKGYISREKAVELLGPLTADKREIDQTLNSADDELAADTRAAAVRGVKRGLMSGEHSDREATGLLTRFGVTPGVADRMVTAWAIDRDTRYKRISAAQAAKMLKDGLIGAEEMRRRLRNLGYALRDADLILGKALQVEGKADGLEPSELDSAINEAIKTRKDAERQGDTKLGNRLRTLWTEASRIIKEINRRREGTDQPQLPLPPAPP